MDPAFPFETASSLASLENGFEVVTDDACWFTSTHPLVMTVTEPSAGGESVPEETTGSSEAP